MKIYTRAGDDGSTGLFGGARVAKDDLRVETYGTVDELNAALGLCASGDRGQIGGLVHTVQNELFTMGASLARLDGKGVKVDPAWTARLEKEIDSAEAELTPLRNFILPGGCELAARLHLARTIARRAERLVVTLSGEAELDAEVVRYLNRLSDWLFVYARLANKYGGVEDVPWTK